MFLPYVLLIMRGSIAWLPSPGNLLRANRKKLPTCDGGHEALLRHGEAKGPTARASSRVTR